MTRATEDGAPVPVPISLVAQHAFCPRRAWLEAVGERTDTHQVAVGTSKHRASDDSTSSRPGHLRAVEVASDTFGVVGRCDLVETDEQGRSTVVEYKATPVRRRATVTEPMVVQLALQAAALREAGYRVDAAAVHFTEHSTRVAVAVDDEAMTLARAHVDGLADVLGADTAPPPLEDDPRCRSCSHIDVCLPDERRLGEVPRRVLVADPDSQVLHLTTPGARAAVRSGHVRVVKGDDELGSVPLERVQAVVVHGNVDLSSGLLRELLWRDCPVVWCSSAGRVIGWATSAARPNGGPRVRQHVMSSNGDLALATGFVSAKIANQATLLRRHGHAVDTVRALRALQRDALRATDIPQVLGIEGDAAARYFSGFGSMLSATSRSQRGVSFTARSRRPAKDPVNAALGYCYGLLVADALRAVVACGMDPHAGFLHSSERNKPALALDLSEEFRAPVADSTVIGAFNNGELGSTDFSSATGACRLRAPARIRLVAAYERRMATVFTHPVFGYKLTWRRAMEVQARLVLGVVDGTQDTYKGVTVR